MSFSCKFKVLAIATALMVPMATAATSKSGKVRSVIGEVTMQKKGEGDWKQLRVGNKVNQPDRIRTLVESNTQIALPDGSTLSIEENSLVLFSQLVNEDGKQTAMTEVIQGKVRFNAQKQNDGSVFKFRTGTATAAIRGTDGIVAAVGSNRFVFGLNTGKMDISADKCPDVSIQGGEMAILDLETCFTKLSISSAGDVSVLNQVLAVLAITGSLEGLQSQMTALNEFIQNFAEQQSASAGCAIEALPDAIDTNAITIKGGCQKDLALSINNELVANAKQFMYSADWAPSAYGTKRFDLRCKESIDIKAFTAAIGLPESMIPSGQQSVDMSYACGSYETRYEPRKEAPKAIEFTVAAKNGDICEHGALEVSGTVSGGPTLDFTVGSYTTSIKTLPEQTEFATTITINDRNGAWNGKELLVVATYDDGKTETKAIPLSINKSCKKVNLLAPTVTLNNPGKCMAEYSVAKLDDDMGILRINRDGQLQKEIVLESNTKGRFRISAGTHVYSAVITDQAGNSSTASQQMKCYPPSNSYLTIDGERAAGVNKKSIHVPPPPDIKGDTYKTIHRTMRLKVKAVPENDYSQLKSIVIKNAATGEKLLNLQGTQIDQLDYDVPVELEYGGKTSFDITVEMYNGNILKSTKIYEVK